MSREIACYTVDRIMKAGADKAQCLIKTTEKTELNVECNEISLLRTTFDTDLTMTALVDHRKGSLSLNKTETSDIDRRIDALLESARASKEDMANDIAPRQSACIFRAGPECPDLDRMYDSTHVFLAYLRKQYPFTNLRGLRFSFTRSMRWLMNSHGVDFEERIGFYTIVAIFASKKGSTVSSFNFASFQMRDIDTPINEVASLETLLKQSSEQTETRALPDKFRGDVIITPDCLPDFIYPLAGYLGDHSLISGNSLYKERLHEKVADSRFTLRSNPTSEDSAEPCFFTPDGFATADSVIIGQGILKSYLLSLYGANKTGRERSTTSGDCFVVDPGTDSFDDMVRAVDRGILLCRFSGGRPSNAGDFSGVAKNSYYIEKGKVCFPLTETMVSGNIITMLERIAAISAERINFGYGIFPWITVTDLTISSK